MERKWWTLLLVSVATFMLLLDVTIVNVALPDIQRELNASLSSLQWVVDAYSLMLASFLLTRARSGTASGAGASSRSASDLHLRLVPLRHRGRSDPAEPRRGLQGIGGAACSPPRWR